ncbi:MAG: photosystem II stability/assembly factor-like uncharacterized protein [Crocinitomicaceae bacterium]|jgi:photosystem II stability/assembly factor-like uncharacterized protein
MKIILLLGLMVFGFSNVNFAQWTQTGGPAGPIDVNKIISNDSILIASTDIGCFYRTNLVDSWTQFDLGKVHDYYISGDTLFALDSYGLKQLQFSSFSGTVTQVSSPLGLSIDYLNNILYIGSQPSGFWWSDNNGVNWITHNAGLPGFSGQGGTEYIVNSTAHSNNYIFAATWDGVYRNSTTLGTWEQKNNGLPPSISMSILEIFDDTLYGTIGGGLYSSSDYAESWTNLYTASSEISSLHKDGSDIYVGTESSGVQHSANNGVTWSAVNNGLTNFEINDVNQFKDTLLCGMNLQGFLNYTNGAWSANNDGIIISSIRSLVSTSNRIFANTSSGVYESAANDSWLPVSIPSPYSFFHELKSSNDTLFLSTKDIVTNPPYTAPYILFSTDLGGSWTQLNSPPFAGDDSYRIEYDNGTLYAHENNYLQSTTDVGATWSELDIPSAFCNSINDFQVENDLAFTALCGYGEVLKSENGSNWELSSNGLPQNSDPDFIALCDGVVFTYVGGHGMFASFDEGNSWSYASSGLGTNKYIRDYTCLGQQLFLATNYGIYSTIDFGQSWYALNGGLTNLSTSSIDVLNDTLYAGVSSSGIWKSAVQELNQTIGISENDFASFEIQLYPNPSNGKFTLQWPDETVKHLDIRILDAVGKEVYTTTHSENPIQFDVNLSPGIYYVSTNSIDNNEVILVKIE